MRIILSRPILLIGALLFGDSALAQQGNAKCTQASPTLAAQTLQCEGGVTIVAENGAQYMLGDANHDGRIDSVELNSKALLLDVEGKSGGRKFQVNTPQAIAAVRGTRWAVDVAEGKTSVFVVHGRVNVGRSASPGDRQVVLGPGEGVDVEASTPLVVKRWAPARVSALMARLGQYGVKRSNAQSAEKSGRRRSRRTVGSFHLVGSRPGSSGISGSGRSRHYRFPHDPAGREAAAG